MKSPIIDRFVRPWEGSPTKETALGCPSKELEVSVIFTDAPGTLAALRAAGTLADGLGTRIKLVVPLAVPYAFPLDRPPVPVAFTEKLLLDLACRAVQAFLETAICLYLCRDRLQTLLEVLEPHSLVVIGGRKHWWPTAETRLAQALRSKGHQGVFIDRK